MLHRIYRLFPLLVVGIAILVLGNTAIYAEAGKSQVITVTPSSTDVSIDPGASISKSINVINGGKGTFAIALSTSPYHVTGEEYDPQFTQLPGTVDASEWVHLSTKSATVTGNNDVTIPYTIDVPTNAAPGGYYAVLFAETSTDNEQTGVVSHNRVGNILYITVNGTVKIGGNLSGDKLPLLHFAGPIQIGTKVSNSGGTHFITNVAYTVTDFKGNDIFKATFDRYVLPQTEREIKSSFTPQSVIGLYTVHRTATVAGTLETLPDQKIFVINPWLLIAITFLLGILVAFPLQRARQRRRSRES